MEKKEEAQVTWKRAPVLRGQLPRDVEVPGKVAEGVSQLGERITEVTSKDIRIPAWEKIHGDPSWVHLNIPGTHHILSFHLSDDGSSLDVHSMGNLDWNRLTWFTFSAAHARAIAALERRGTISPRGRELLEQQLFTAASFTRGYGNPVDSHIFSPREGCFPVKKFIMGSWLIAFLVLAALHGLEGALLHMAEITVILAAALLVLLAIAVMLLAPTMLLADRMAPRFPLLSRLADSDLLIDMDDLWNEHGELFLPRAGK